VNHEVLINSLLGFHGAVFVIAIGCFWKCVDRTAMFASSYKNYENTIRKIKERIFGDLSLALKPLFSHPDEKAIGILNLFGPEGEYWKEEEANVQETEEYKNAVMGFIKDNASALADFKTISSLVRKCKYWAGYLRWSIFGVLILQAISLFLFWVLDKIYGHTFGNLTIYVIVGVSVIFIINGFLSLPLLLYYHGKADDYGSKYD
jgi:hypothetical protein